MYTVKLIKGLSCRVGTVRATKAQPICTVEDKAAADAAVASGYFKWMLEPVRTVSEDITEKPIAKMTIEECKAFAEAHNIDISGLSKVAELREKIATAGETADDDFEIDMGKA